ncbi:MAG: BON domain-containing protein [Nitriliruptoraceae bacterium]
MKISTPSTVRLLIGAAGAAAVASARWATSARGKRALRKQMRRCRARTRDIANRSRGLCYRLTGREPSPAVSDAVLEQRIRSTLGPVAKRLDIPRVSVASSNHHVTLTGAVGSADDARLLDDLVRAVPGVRDLTCDLQVGFTLGERRPSEGRHDAHSPMHRELTVAAENVGVDAPSRTIAAAAALGTFLQLLPIGERDHVRTHLPADVRALLDSAPATDVSGVIDHRTLQDAVAASAGAALTERTDGLIRAVLAILRARVPEEVGDIAAVLPVGLKPLWNDPQAPRSG